MYVISFIKFIYFSKPVWFLYLYIICLWCELILTGMFRSILLVNNNLCLLLNVNRDILIVHTRVIFCCSPTMHWSFNTRRRVHSIPGRRRRRETFRKVVSNSYLNFFLCKLEMERRHIYLKFKRYCSCVLFQHIKLEK